MVAKAATKRARGKVSAPKEAVVVSIAAKGNTALPRGRARAYEGASNSRLTDNWIVNSTSADTEIFGAGRTLRDRSRDLVRNNPHAAKAVASLVSNIIGEGIMPRPKTGDLSKDKIIKAAFDKWASAGECDADGQLDFYGLQTLICREMIEGGEVLVRRRLRRSTDGYDVPLQLQILEADFLDPFRNGIQENNNMIIQGVEFATSGPMIGKRTAYWLYANHPGSIFFNMRGSLVSSPTPASEVLHVYEKLRTQARGVPWGAASIRSMQDLGDYEYAEIVRKKLESCNVGVVTTDDDAEIGINRDPNATDTSYENPPAGVVDFMGNPIERFEPGMFAYARGGKEIRFNSPATIGGYNEYKVSQLRSIAAGFRVPYELLSGDLSQVNFSSIRSGLLEFRRFTRAVQWQILVPMFLQPVWEWFCEAAFLAGEIPDQTVKVEWAPPRFEWVNPTDDVAADLMALRSGLRSFADIVSEMGRDPVDVLDEVEAFQKDLFKRGIVLDSDPSAVSGRGVTQKNDPVKPTYGDPHPDVAGTTGGRSDARVKKRELEAQADAYQAALKRIAELEAQVTESKADRSERHITELVKSAIEAVRSASENQSTRVIEAIGTIPAPSVRVDAPVVNVATPDVKVDVHLPNPKKASERTVVTKHDAAGRVAEFERHEIEE